MSRRKKLKILIPLIMLLFLGSYARHRLLYVNNISGTLNSKQMDEISGIAASSINPDTYYVHNDSGDTSRFFSIDSKGKLKTTIYFNGDKKKRFGVQDCEDIAVGPGPKKGKSYVYLGDIGDNNNWRKYITVYRFQESTAWTADTTTHAIPVAIHLRYPDGPKDAETLMVDPVEKLMYIVTKRGDSVGVYTSPLKFTANDTLTLTKRATLFFAGFKPFKWITAGDISKDGQQIILRSYEKVYYWRRQPTEHAWDAMVRKPKELPYTAEKQGEAIGFTPDGKGYYTTSEGVFSPVYYYDSPEK